MEIDVVEPFVIQVTVPDNTVNVNAVAGEAVLVVPTPGPPGTPGPAGDGTQVFGEVPSGGQDGVNDSFTLSHGFQAGSTAVFRNGLREQLNVGYTESSPEIVFTSPPLSSDVITVDYLLT